MERISNMYDYDVATSIINVMRKIAIDKYKKNTADKKEAAMAEIGQYNKEYQILSGKGTEAEIKQLYKKVFSEYSPIVKAYVRG